MIFGIGKVARLDSVVDDDDPGAAKAVGAAIAPTVRSAAIATIGVAIQVRDIISPSFKGR